MANLHQIVEKLAKHFNQEIKNGHEMPWESMSTTLYDDNIKILGTRWENNNDHPGGEFIVRLEMEDESRVDIGLKIESIRHL